MTHLDGNAIAGELSEVFAGDLTSAIATCAGCGTTGALATGDVYETIGTVLRCPECDSVLLRLVHIRDDVCIEMRGVRVLRMTRTA